jgi:hypothetical protein
MKLDELSKPIINKKISKAVNDYYHERLKDGNYVDMDDVRNLNSSLKKFGWNNIGFGSFSIVYENPKKNYVLKVNKTQDTGYALFVNLIRKYPNKHFPKISDLKRMEIDGSLYYIYLIEKLSEFIHPYAYSIANGLNIIAKYNPAPKYFYSYMNENQIKFLLKQPELIKAARILGKHHGRHFMDIHKQNIMVRNDGTLVIIDPYAVFD